MRLVIDSDQFESINEYEWPHKIGYVNGRSSAWTPSQIRQAQAKGQLLALVDVLGNAPHQAAIIDFERGDVQDPSALLKWVIVRNEFRDDAVVYCNRSSLPTVIQALRGVSWRLWLAEPMPDSQPPMTPPKDIHLPANAKLLGVQYALAPQSGGHYDMSIFYDDFWHATKDSAAELLGERELAQPGHAPHAAELEEGLPEVDGPPAEPAASSAPPATSGPSGSSPVDLRPVPAAALSRSSGSASATSSAHSAASSASPSSSPAEPAAAVSLGLGDVAEQLGLPDPAAALQPVAVLGQDGRDSGRTMWDRVTKAPSAEDGPGYEDQAHTAASTAAAASAGQGDPGRLPHAWMARALSDVRHVAELFHGAGAHEVAELLEQATRHADEVGKLLQMAGK